VREEAGKKIISWGESAFGYDVRLDDEFKIFTNINSSVIDPLDFKQNCCVDHEGPCCIIPPNSYVLGKTMETFDIPRTRRQPSACGLGPPTHHLGTKRQRVVHAATRVPAGLCD
jgi:hypothetical protein